MNAATILKFKGGGVFTITANKSLLDIAKLLVQHGIGCIVIVGYDDKIAGHHIRARSHTSDRPSRP